MSPPERLRDELERTHAEISQLRDYNDFCHDRGRAPPDHYYRDLDILHSRCDQLSLALAESLQAFASSRCGRSPVIASPRVAPPSDAPRPPRPDSSSLQGPRLSPWSGPSSQDRRRPRTPPAIFLFTVASQRSAITTDSFLALDIATIGDSVQGSSLLLSDWESPQGVPPLQCEWDSLQGGPLLQSEWDSPQGSPLSTANGIRFKGVPFSKANRIRLKWVPLSKANGSRLKVFLLSNANGIRFKGVPFSKANGIRFKGFPLSTATVFRFKGLCFTSTSALIQCFVW